MKALIPCFPFTGRINGLAATIAAALCCVFLLSSPAARAGNVFQGTYRPPLRRAAPQRISRPERAKKNPKPAAVRESASPKRPAAPERAAPAAPERQARESERSSSPEPVHHEPRAGSEQEVASTPRGGEGNRPVGAGVVAPARAVSRDFPGQLEVTRSQELMKEVYARDMTDESIPGRRRLADELLADARRSRDNAADQYVLLCGAIRAGREGRHLRRIYEILDEMAGYYDIDVPEARWEIVQDMPLEADTQPNTLDNVREGLELVDQLAAAGDYASALKLCGLLATTASVDPTLTQMVQTRTSEVRAMIRVHDVPRPETAPAGT